MEQEGYYQSQVNRILSSVVGELSKNPDRRFVWAESSFFMRWFESESEEIRTQFRALVASGQVEFVGGGWVQNDEANPDFGAVISQLTEGHEYLQQLFGKRPRIAWQIDPFGHAAATAAIASAAGYEALVINRIDHSIKDSLKSHAGLEFWWSPYSPGVAASEGVGTYAGNETAIFTHVLHKHYSAPVGYDFENPEGYAVGGDPSGRAQGLVHEIRNRARAYRTSHILVPFGDDFKFQNAARQFENMDALVKHINTGGVGGGPAFPGFRIRYSTLGEYFDAVFEELGVSQTAGAAPTGNSSEARKIPPPPPLPIYSPASPVDGGVDFFPYADNPNSYWAGYFVSRPSLKSAIRRVTSLLRGVDALLALTRPSAGVWAAISERKMREALTSPSARHGEGIAAQKSLSLSPYLTFSWLAAFQRLEQVRLDVALCLHHDAITGTSRDYVVADYSRRMQDGGQDALSLLADLSSMLLGSSHLTGGETVDEEEISPAPLTQAPHVISVPFSRSSASLEPPKEVGGGVEGVWGQPVVFFNPSAWNRTSLGRVVVDVGSVVGGVCGGGKRWPLGLVRDSNGAALPSQWLAMVEARDGEVEASIKSDAESAVGGTVGGVKRMENKLFHKWVAGGRRAFATS